MMTGLNAYYNYYTLFQSLILMNPSNSSSTWHINSPCINSSLICSLLTRTLEGQVNNWTMFND
jgi:hypothetical protein